LPCCFCFNPRPAAAAGIRAGEKIPVRFDFKQLRRFCLSVKLDVGASSYWSEIASLQTLDNLLAQGKISLVDYLERVPNGYVSKQQELIDKLRSAEKQPTPAAGGAQAAMPDGIIQKLTGADQFRQ
jgi:hypothetical protein